jgi:hypothetical protein
LLYKLVELVESRNHSHLGSDDCSTRLDTGPTLVGKASPSFYLCILGTLGGPKIANLGASHQGNFHLSEVTQRITSDWWKLPASLFIFKKLFFMLKKSLPNFRYRKVLDLGPSGFSTPTLSLPASRWHLRSRRHYIQHQGFFWWGFLWCSQGGDHPETNLANSGYMPDKKVEKNQDPSIFLTTYWNLL